MSKTLILMHGLPGSGKSSTETMKDAHHDANSGKYAVCSTDSVWNSEDGHHYLFCGDCLGMAHQINLAKAKMAMSKEIEFVIIDNTNLTFKECKPYCSAAKEAGYNVEVIQPITMWTDDPYQCWIHNTHNVPSEVIKRMAGKKTDFHVLCEEVANFMKEEL